MTIRTKRGALRRYNAILRQCFKDMAGGLQFGLDWPTLRITRPEIYAHLKSMSAAYNDLPN